MKLPVIRWAQRMERDDIGGFVTYHDYAMLYEQMEALRSDMQRRIKIGKELTDEIERLRAERDELESRLAEIEAQEPVAVFTGAYGGRWTFAMLDNDAVPHTAMALYASPAAPHPVKEETK